MGTKSNFAHSARHGFWIFPGLLILALAACIGVTPVANTPISEPTSTPEKASYQLSLEKSIGKGIAQAVDWSPDGRSFVIATSIKVDLYDAASMEVTGALDTGQSGLVVKYSPDGSLLTIAVEDGSVQIWDISQKRKIHSFTGTGFGWGRSPAQILSFSNDGKKLAIANDQTVYILDVSSGKLMDTFPGHGNGIISVSFNPQGNILLAASQRQVFVRDVTTRELLYPAIDLLGDIKIAFFDKTGKGFITVSTSDTYNDATSKFDYVSHISLWDLATGQFENEYDATHFDVDGVATDLAQGKIVLGSDNRIDIWNMSAQKVTEIMIVDDERVNSLALSPDGAYMISIAGQWTRTAQLWDLSGHKVIKDFDQYSLGATDVLFNHDGGLVAEAGANHIIQVKDANSGQLLYWLKGGAPIAFSSDGKILAFAKDNDYLGMIDAQTGQLMPYGNFACTGLKAIAFTPDGKAIAYGGEYRDNCSLQLHDVKSGELILDFQTVEGNEYLSFDTLSTSPDGSKLVLDGYHITTLGLKTGKKLYGMDDVGETRIAFSPDGRYLAFSGVGGYSGGGGKVQILDVATNQPLFILKTNQSAISKMAFSPDGQLMAIAGESVEIWDAWTGQPLSQEENFPSRIIDLAFNQDGDGLLTFQENSVIQHWKIARESKETLLSQPTPTLIPTLTPTLAANVAEVNPIAELGKGTSSHVYYSPDGNVAAFMDGDNLVWFDTSNFEQLGEIGMEYSTGQLVFSPNGKIVVAGAQIVDLQNKEIVGRVSGGNGPTFGYTFSKDSQYMAYVIGDRTSGGPYESIGVWSVADHRDVGSNDENYFPTLLADRYHVMSPPAISPNGKLVAAGHNDKRVYVWDLKTGETRYILEGHAAIVNAVAFSPNGSLLASGSSDGTVRLWNLSTGKLVRVLTGFLDDVFDVSFSADGRSLTVSVAEHPDQVVDLQSGRSTAAPSVTVTPDPFEVRQYQQGYSSDAGTIFSSVSFSPDGRILALASQNVLLWDVATQKLLTFLDNSQGGVVRGLAFSSDGKRLAVTTESDDIIAWNLQTGKRVFSQQSDFLNGGTVVYGAGDTELGPARGRSVIAEQGLSFSPDNQLLAFGNDNSIEIWNIAETKKVATFLNPKGQYATQVSFSADGKHLYAVLNRNRLAQVWDVNSGSLSKQVSLPDVAPNAYSAVALTEPLFARNNSQTDQGSWVELWNLESGKSLKLNMPSAENEPLRFSPDGSLLLVTNDGNTYFWKTTTGQLVYQTHLKDVGLSGLTLSPDNLRLATENQGKAQLWDVSQIIQLAQRSNIPGFSPHPTPTPVVFAWPTPTPQPTATALSGAEAGAASAILPNNAGKLKEQASFGQGTVEQVAWGASGDSILVTGSLGTFEYGFKANSLTLGNVSRAGKDSWSYDTVVLPDGRMLSSGESNGHVYVWDVSTGAVLANLEGKGRTAISPDGNLLAYINPDRELQIWDVLNKTAVTTLPSYTFSFRSPIFSPDGNLVAAIKTGYGRYDDSVRVWNARTGEIVNALSGPDNDITNLSFSKDGRFITGAAGGSGWIWDIRPGIPPNQTELYQVEINDNLNIYTHTVTAIMLSPDNTLAVIGTSENQLQLYQRQTHQKLRDFKGLSSPARQLSFSPDGNTLLSVDEDGLIGLWDVASGKLLTSLDKHLGEIGGFLFRQDEMLSLWGTGTNWVIQPKDGKLIHATHISGGKILAASPSGKLLAVYNPFQMSVWDAETGKFKQTLEGEATTPWVEYYWEGLALRQFYAAAFSADGSRLATAGAGGVWIYDTSNNRLLQQFQGSNAQKLAISSDGNLILTSLYDQSQPVSAYNLQTGDTTLGFGSTGSDVFQAVFSLDRHWAGAVQRTWNGPYELILCSTTGEQPIKSLELGKETPGISLAFNPTSTLVAVGLADGKILLVDLAEMRVITTIIGHQGPVEHLAFSPDGIYLVSGGTDGTIRIGGTP